jgi:DNA-binding MarR family transcriptional regulator
MGNAFASELKAFDLTLSEWRVCASLLGLPGQTLSELAPHAATKISAVSRIVDRLEDMGLVVRGRSESDGRAVHMNLTTKGLNLTQKIVPLAHAYEAIVLDGFSRSEIAVLRDMLNRIYASAERLKPEE